MKTTAIFILCLALLNYHCCFCQTKIDTSFLTEINGVKQYLEIKGTSKKNPLLLLIHGGPSEPLTPTFRTFDTSLFNYVTVVSWDQRNCGKSQTDTTVKLTLDLYVSDAHQVTQQLKKMFSVRKIIVACHSFGSMIGTMLVTKYPQDYAAYIGIGQFTNFRTSEAASRSYFIQQARLKNDTASLNMLQSISFKKKGGYKNGFDDVRKFRQLEFKNYYGQDTTKPDPSQLFADYKNEDWNETIRTIKSLAPYMDTINIARYYTSFKMPVYLMEGRYDYICNYTIVKNYFQTIKAPKKEITWFEKSGHSPFEDEPQLFYNRLIQVAASVKNNTRCR